jgi:hypothetical protein
MYQAFLVNYVTGRRQITKVKVEKIICEETIQECLCLCAPPSCMLLVSGADDDATTCAFQGGVAKLTEQP